MIPINQEYGTIVCGYSQYYLCKCKGTVPLFYEFTGLDGKKSTDITQEGLKCGMMK